MSFEVWGKTLCFNYFSPAVRFYPAVRTHRPRERSQNGKSSIVSGGQGKTEERGWPSKSGN